MVARGLVFILLFIFIPEIPAPARVQKKSTDIPADVLITLNRGGLRITIVADGRVDVQGQTFDFDIAAIGVRISREEMRALIGEFDRIDFFALRDRYRDAADGYSSDGRVHSVATIQTTSFTVNGNPNRLLAGRTNVWNET